VVSGLLRETVCFVTDFDPGIVSCLMITGYALIVESRRRIANLTRVSTAADVVVPSLRSQR
jgi:hypothetical protein